MPHQLRGGLHRSLLYPDSNRRPVRLPLPGDPAHRVPDLTSPPMPPRPEESPEKPIQKSPAPIAPIQSRSLGILGTSQYLRTLSQSQNLRIRVQSQALGSPSRSRSSQPLPPGSLSRSNLPCGETRRTSPATTLFARKTNSTAPGSRAGSGTGRPRSAGNPPTKYRRTSNTGVNYDYEVAWEEGCTTDVETQKLDMPLSMDGLFCVVSMINTWKKSEYEHQTPGPRITDFSWRYGE